MMTDDLERIRAAMYFIPASDRDTWLKIGMAIKAELGDTGFDVWEAWSLQDDSFNPRTARDVWKSIRGNGKVTAGTLFYEAKAHGWRDDGTHPKPTPEELAERRRIAAELAAKEGSEIARKRADAMKKASAIWNAAIPTSADHPYLSRKHVSPVATLREIDAGAAEAILGYVPKSGGNPLVGRLLVAPIKVGDSLSTIELIDSNGRKTAIAGGGKAGGYWAAQPLPHGDVDGLVLLIGEGVATVLSVKEATRHPAVAALSSGNLLAVAKIMRERYPSAALVLLADLVKETGTPDPHAIEAALSVGGLLAIPDFGTDRPREATDFNDLHQAQGLEAVQAILVATMKDGKTIAPPDPKNLATDISTVKHDALEPEPLRATLPPAEPYPVGALGDVLGAAASAIHESVKAPLAMCCQSVLAAASLAVQAHYDIKLPWGELKPLSLFLLTVGESGERKSGVDNLVLGAAKIQERAEMEVYAQDMTTYETDLAAWTQATDAARKAVTGGKKGAATATDVRVAAGRCGEKPVPPIEPLRFVSDPTVEGLYKLLATGKPSVALFSDEGGLLRIV